MLRIENKNMYLNRGDAIALTINCNETFSANDVIIAIDGIKATTKLLEKFAKREGRFIVFAFRRDELMQFELQGGITELAEVELKVDDQAKVEKWLNI